MVMSWWQEWLAFFRPLQIKNLQVFWSGQVCALIGMWLQVTAMGILVYELSGGSGSAVGFLAALNAIPFFLGGTFLSGLGDKFPRRKVLMAVQACQWGIAIFLFLLTWLGCLELWHIYVAGLMMGINQTIGFPAQQVFVGDLVPRSQLQEAVGMYSLVFNTCRAIGPALAGFIIARYGAVSSFGGNVIAALPLIGCLMFLKSRLCESDEGKRSRSSRRKASGLRAVWRNKALLFIMISALIQNVCAQSLYQIIPALMQGHPQNTGTILGSVGAGAVTSILFVLPFVKKFPQLGCKLSGGTMWMGICFIVAGLLPFIEIQASCFFLAGIATSALFVTSSAAVQLLAPVDRRTSILGILSIVTIGVQPLAAMVWGMVVDVCGASVTMILAGGSEFLFSILMLCIPFWRKYHFSPKS